MKLRKSLILLLFVLHSCIPIPVSTNNTTQPVDEINKEFTTENHVYEDNFKSILLYPQSAGKDAKDVLNPSLTFITQSSPLILEFDEIRETSQDYRVKIVHCTYDWKVSLLNDIEFINDFNEFQIRDYQSSFNTKIPYTHYSFKLPKLKISGNYVLKVYRGLNDKDLIFTKRFVIYENKVTIHPELKFSSKSPEREKNQQIEFKISHTGYDLINPRDQVKVVVRQNYRWDKAIYDLKPLYIRDFEKLLEYTHFNLENNFTGSNEFRRFDIQSTRFLGFNVAGIDITDTIVNLRLQTDRTRNGRPYVRQNEMNGGYLVNHYESNEGASRADYINVKFTLLSPQPASGEVYVIGDFNNWQYTHENKMHYSETDQAYVAEILLKQGQYNYMYALMKPGEDKLDDTFFEGSFTETENNYDILVYYRPIGSRADLVIGYKTFNTANK